MEPVYTLNTGTVYTQELSNKSVVSLVVYESNNEVKTKILNSFVPAGTDVIVKNPAGWYNGIYFNDNNSLLKFEFSIKKDNIDAIQPSKQQIEKISKGEVTEGLLD